MFANTVYFCSVKNLNKEDKAMKVGDKRIKDEAVNGGRRASHSSAARTSLVGDWNLGL